MANVSGTGVVSLLQTVILVERAGSGRVSLIEALIVAESSSGIGSLVETVVLVGSPSPGGVRLVQPVVVVRISSASAGGVVLLEYVLVEAGLLRLVLSSSGRGISLLIVLRSQTSHILCLVDEGSHIDRFDSYLVKI